MGERVFIRLNRSDLALMDVDSLMEGGRRVSLGQIDQVFTDRGLAISTARRSVTNFWDGYFTRLTGHLVGNDYRPSGSGRFERVFFRVE